jgi:hypothetical protein
MKFKYNKKCESCSKKTKNLHLIDSKWICFQCSQKKLAKEGKLIQGITESKFPLYNTIKNLK